MKVNMEKTTEIDRFFFDKEFVGDIKKVSQRLNLNHTDTVFLIFKRYVEICEDYRESYKNGTRLQLAKYKTIFSKATKVLNKILNVSNNETTSISQIIFNGSNKDS